MKYPTVIDHRRRAGWRKPGGLYLRADNLPAACGKLPIRLDVCPVCGEGIKFARGFKWINPQELTKFRDCSLNTLCDGSCLLREPADKSGMMWIGYRFYPSPAEFRQEAAEQGVSIRVRTLPHGFEVGETQVFLAHNRVQMGQKKRDIAPAVFTMFVPKLVEYVISGDETEEELEKLVARDILPVHVQRAENGDQDETKEDL